MAAIDHSCVPAPTGLADATEQVQHAPRPREARPVPRRRGRRGLCGRRRAGGGPDGGDWVEAEHVIEERCGGGKGASESPVPLPGWRATGGGRFECPVSLPRRPGRLRKPGDMWQGRRGAGRGGGEANGGN